ncbi:MAG: beta/gamma crystallin-related protein [Candidatus Poribacteria bacterium]
MRRVTIPRLIVEVFDRWGFGGRRAIIINPIRSLAEFGFENNISSIRIYKGQSFHSAPIYKTIFYEDEDFHGRKLALGPGIYPNIHDVAYNFGDRISSVNFAPSLDVTGPEWGSVPAIIELYRLPDFKGFYATVLRDLANTEEIGLNDAITSIRIYKGPDCPSEGFRIILYQRPNFEGESLPIEISQMDYKKEIPDLRVIPETIGNAISSIKIESWTSSTEFSEIVFQDEFDRGQLRKEWRLEDQGGGFFWRQQQGYAEFRAATGHDLFHETNFDTPRLTQEVMGDFAIETRMRVTPQLQEYGGLLIWKNQDRFLRFEKTSATDPFRGDIRFERHIWRRRSLIKRISEMRHVNSLYMRLERSGQIFNAYASANGINWLDCGTAIMGVGDPISVGIYGIAPGRVAETVTQFDYFRIMRRSKEITRYRPIRVKERGITRTERATAIRELTR